MNNSVVAESDLQIPSPQEQKIEFLSSMSTPLEAGKIYFLISSKWLAQWKEYVGFDGENSVGEKPGQIPNDTLISFTTKNDIAVLQSNLQDETDFVMVPERCGQLLHQWYGGAEIKRSVIGKPGNEIIEIHPLVIKLALFKEAKVPLEFIDCAFGKEQTIKDVILFAKRYYDLDFYDLHCWTAYLGSPYKLISEESTEIGSYAARLNPQFCIEKKDHYEWPLSFKHRVSSAMSSDSYPMSTRSGNDYGSSTRHYQSYTQPTEPGLSGLSNLGNTCFMNSALQCLTKTPHIQDYFLKKDWKSEINLDNPLGMGGKIANVFGELMTDMWSGKSSVITPRDFKQIIGDFQPQFSGYSQQDSQELISYLLDGIHEDLNRIVKKPSTTKPEGTLGEDEKLAVESWKTHLLRNNSIVTDHMQGMLKSTLVCPDCGNVAVTFDPYMYLPLPLPMEKNRILKVIVMKKDNVDKAIECAFLVHKSGTVKEIRQCAADFLKCEPRNVVVCDIYSNKIFKFLSDQQPISTITDRDVTFAYQLDDIKEGSHGDHYTWEKEKEAPFCGVRLMTVDSRQSQGSTPKLVPMGQPFVIEWSPKDTSRQIYDRCFNFIKRFLKPEALVENEYDLQKPETLFPNKDTVTMMEGKPKLFCLLYDQGYDDYTHSLNYDDEVVEPKQLYSTQDKRILAMVIHTWVIENLVDKEAFETVLKDQSIADLKLAEEKGVSLEDCINLFTQKETLGQDDNWYCGKCQKFVQATKKLDIWQVPDVLIINLKRFQFTKYHREKIDALVNFPLKDLDLSNFVESAKVKPGDYKYDLFAVSNHFGSLSGGHYTAYAKVNDKWYDFNDSSVSEQSEKSIVSSSAYVLFYVNNAKTAETVVKGKIHPTQEQIDEEERLKKLAVEKKKQKEEEEREERVKKEQSQLLVVKEEIITLTPDPIIVEPLPDENIQIENGTLENK